MGCFDADMVGRLVWQVCHLRHYLHREGTVIVSTRALVSKRGASQLASKQAVQAGKQAHRCADSYADVRQPSRHTLVRQSAQGQYAVAAGTLEACRINLASMYS